MAQLFERLNLKEWLDGDEVEPIELEKKLAGGMGSQPLSWRQSRTICSLGEAYEAASSS